MREAARFIESKTSIRPKIGVVLGSGLGAFAESLGHTLRLPYGSIPGLPVATATGHSGELVIGTLGADGKGTVDLAVMSGRFHLYEGYTAKQVTSGMRLFRELGVERIVLTNAAGGINPAFAEGALVLISDHINLQGANPLVGRNDEELGPRFPDMTEAYSPRMRQLARDTADEFGITLHEGVYGALVGPSYETPAEIRFLKTIGADLVGMSTVLETIAAQHMGLEVLGISCVTNLAAGLSGEKLNHQEVLEIAERVSGTFLKLLRALLPKLT
ncbi:MAG: purine-nucleoside phosphorylase [Acidobacteriaceae bacterium]|nr:purine-nucleoside phosphorylase [Acidobacteriaceae bacterium]MBV9781168.1 purine-nucleoside phosphorylase [Acidobacteriaceae bacterium]